MKRFASLVFLVACTQSNPPPQYPQYQQPPQQAQPAQQAPQPAQQQAAASQPTPPAQPEPAPVEELPIDPKQPMPKESLTTNATLELGKEATVTLDSRSDIFSSGLPKADGGRTGVMPSTITLAKGGGIISFPKVVGKATCNANVLADADGGACAGGKTKLKGAGKLSGIEHAERTMFLVAVFLGPALPKKAPATLDFSDAATGTKFDKLEPVLGQVFFVGNGKPGDDPLGSTHDFLIPKGATRLFLGYADGFSFQGSPGAYSDNRGGLAVTVLQRK